jgi:TonB family protein
MKTKFQYFIIVIFSLMASSSFSQISEADNPIFLVANGSGMSKEDAHQDALKSCISLAISGLTPSNLNPNLSSETLQNLILNSSTFLDYSVAYDDQLPNGKIASTLNVRINTDSFINVLRNAGINIEFKGGKIALQIKQQILNENSETATLSHMLTLLNEPMHSVFVYKIKSSFPKSLDDRNKEWAIPLTVQVYTNRDIDYCAKFFFHTLSELNIEPEELSLYEKMNKKTFPIRLNHQGNSFNFLLRRNYSVTMIERFIDKWENYLLNFKVMEGKNEYVGSDAVFIENSSAYNNSTSNESIVNAKKVYQFPLNKHSNHIDLQFPKALQLVGEYSWNDVKNLSQIESIEDYTVQSRGYINNSVEDKNLNDENSGEPEEEIFTAVEHQAEFPGGSGAWGRYLNKTLKYPSSAQKKNIGGRVFVSFVVNIDGTIQDVQVLKGVGYGCDEEAVRVVKSMPRWNPAKQSGRAVRSRFTQPITFVLSE